MRGKALKFLGLFLLLLGFLLLWSGLRISSAIDGGALDQPMLCFDARHLGLERQGQTPPKIVDQVLTRQVAMHHYQSRGPFYSHVALAFSQLGWVLFWSPEQRREYYGQVAAKMKPCPGAEERLERHRKTGHYTG